MLLPDLTGYFLGEKPLFHGFRVLFWCCLQQCWDIAAALHLARKPRRSCWKLQMIRQWSNATARCEEMPYRKQCHLSSEAQKQSPDYLWLLKVLAHLLKSRALNPSALAKIYFQRFHSGYQHFLYCSSWIESWPLHPVPNWASLCFGTADIFQRQPQWSGVWSDLYISLTCLTGMEWGLINYD